MTIPGTSGQVAPSPEAMAAPWAAVTKAGAQVNKLGDELFDVAARLNRQKEDAILTETGTKINDEYLQFRLNHEKTAKGKDAFGSMDKAAEFTRSMMEKYTNGTEESQRYGTLLRRHIAAQDHLLKNQFATYEAAQVKDYNTDVRKLDLNSSLKIAQSGDYNTAVLNHMATLNDQKGNGALSQNDYDIERTNAISAIGVAHILSLKDKDPVSANAVFEALKPTLTAADVQRLGPGLQEDVKRQTGNQIGTEIFKTDKTGSLETMIDAVTGRKLDPDTAKNAETRIKELFAARETDRKLGEDKALDALSADLLGKTKNSKGYILPSHLSGPAWDAYKMADPKGALNIQNQAGHNLDALTTKNITDRMHKIQLRNMEFDEKADAILRADDFATRDLRKDFLSGSIGEKQYKQLVDLQNKLDPLKHESVKSALKKIEAGTALGTALELGSDKANEIAVWRQKYGNLVREFTLKNVNDPNFDAKLNDFMEKNILNDFVASWLSSDETDRQRKFEKAQKAAGVTGQVKSQGGDNAQRTPVKTSWMAQARKANPKASEQELSAYYDKKYGGKK